MTVPSYTFLINNSRRGSVLCAALFSTVYKIVTCGFVVVVDSQLFVAFRHADANKNAHRPQGAVQEFCCCGTWIFTHRIQSPCCNGLEYWEAIVRSIRSRRRITERVLCAEIAANLRVTSPPFVIFDSSSDDTSCFVEIQ